MEKNKIDIDNLSEPIIIILPNGDEMSKMTVGKALKNYKKYLL